MNRIYLGGPINACADSECRDWRDRLAPKLSTLGFEILNPMCRDYRGKELEHGNAKQIVEQDLADIKSCDILIFNCTKPSYGTAMEIFWSHSIGKHIITIVPREIAPSPWLLAHSTQIIYGYSEEQIIKIVNDIIKNETQII